MKSCQFAFCPNFWQLAVPVAFLWDSYKGQSGGGIRTPPLKGPMLAREGECRSMGQAGILQPCPICQAGCNSCPSKKKLTSSCTEKGALSDLSFSFLFFNSPQLRQANLFLYCFASLKVILSNWNTNLYPPTFPTGPHLHPGINLLWDLHIYCVWSMPCQIVQSESKKMEGFALLSCQPPRFNQECESQTTFFPAQLC